MKNIRFAMILIVLAAFGFQPLRGQTADPYIVVDDEEELDDAGLPPDDDDPVDTPIDGGLTLLLAAGAGYGVNRCRRKRRGTTD